MEPLDAAIAAIREIYPHGHPSFLPTTVREIELHSNKNHDYASGGDPMGNFNRVAAILGLYPDLKISDPRVVALTYMLKQLDAVLWGLNANITQKVEGIRDRMGDVSVYAKIVMCLDEDHAKAAAANSVCAAQSRVPGLGASQYFCTLRAGHDGDHCAQSGLSGHTLYSWRQ